MLCEFTITLCLAIKFAIISKDFFCFIIEHFIGKDMRLYWWLFGWQIPEANNYSCVSLKSLVESLLHRRKSKQTNEKLKSSKKPVLIMHYYKFSLNEFFTILSVFVGVMKKAKTKTYFLFSWFYSLVFGLKIYEFQTENIDISHSLN